MLLHEVVHRAVLEQSNERGYRLLGLLYGAPAAGALAASLRGRGVGPGDRVGLLSGNRPEWHIADPPVLTMRTEAPGEKKGQVRETVVRLALSPR